MSMYSRDDGDDVEVKDYSRTKTIVESIEDHIERSIAEIEAGYSNRQGPIVPHRSETVLEESKRMIAEHRAKSVERINIRAQLSERENENVFNQSEQLSDGQKPQFMKGMT